MEEDKQEEEDNPEDAADERSHGDAAEDTPDERSCFTSLKASNFASKHLVPKTYRAARYGGKWDDWKPAFDKQMEEFNQLHVWDLVDPPKRANVLPGK